MSVPLAVTAASQGRRSGGRRRVAIRELDRVRLRAQVISDGRTLPIGQEGTAVHRYGSKVAFEVEFHAPFHAVVTLRSDEIERLA